MVNSISLTIFRHALTKANENKEYLGWTDEALSEKGRKETQAIAELLTGWQADEIISSDLVRCTETTEILFPYQKYQTMKAFREMNFGCFEGQTYDELKDDKAYQLWLDQIFEKQPPMGESFIQFSKRISEGMKDWVSSLDDEHHDLVLVTHGGVLRYLLTEYVDSDKDFFDWRVPNSQGYQLIWEKREAFRRLDVCTSLSAVPLMGKKNG